jgi:hypothetical protein
MTKTTPEAKARIRRLYSIISDRNLDGRNPKVVQDRVEILREMEGILRTSFLNTKDFRAKISRFL